MKLLLLDVLGVLVSSDSLLDREEFLGFCKCFKESGGEIVLYSNSHSRIMQNNFLKDFIDRYVDEGYFIDSNIPPKPSGESLEYILQKHNVSPNECLYVDDGLHNIELAQQLGINTIFYTSSDEVIRNMRKCLK